MSVLPQFPCRWVTGLHQPTHFSVSWVRCLTCLTLAQMAESSFIEVRHVKRKNDILDHIFFLSLCLVVCMCMSACVYETESLIGPELTNETRMAGHPLGI